jgi:hypothetical protein
MRVGYGIDVTDAMKMYVYPFDGQCHAGITPNLVENPGCALRRAHDDYQRPQLGDHRWYEPACGFQIASSKHRCEAYNYYQRKQNT